MKINIGEGAPKREFGTEQEAGIEGEVASKEESGTEQEISSELRSELSRLHDNLENLKEDGETMQKLLDEEENSSDENGSERADSVANAAGQIKKIIYGASGLLTLLAVSSSSSEGVIHEINSAITNYFSKGENILVFGGVMLSLALVCATPELWQGAIKKLVKKIKDK